MGSARDLVIVADDFGIGPETSRGILELGAERRITATVLLVNSPHAADAVAAWEWAGRPLVVGWHPCLTLDRPLLPPDRVPSLVDHDGSFHQLGPFLRRACLGRIRATDVDLEFRAQYARFLELTGRPPPIVNTHQHVALFGPVGDVLRNLLCEQSPLPFLRRVYEPWRTLIRVPGARIKRLVLARRGAAQARHSDGSGLPGCDVLAGVTDPECVANEAFFTRWLRAVPGRSVELMCHPGHRDDTLVGRDCCGDDSCVARRVNELRLLRSPAFGEACAAAGLRLVPACELLSGLALRRAA